MARGELRALVGTASLDLGVDWGDIDLRRADGRAERLEPPAAAHRPRQSPARPAEPAILVPGNRFEFLEAQAAKDAVDQGQRDGEDFRPGGARRARPARDGLRLRRAVRRGGAAGGSALEPAPYAWIDQTVWQRVLHFVATGGYALRSLRQVQAASSATRTGTWRLTHPEHAQRHRMNAGIIVDAEMIEIRFRNGRSLGKVEEQFAASLSPATRSASPGWTWRSNRCATSS